MLCANNENGALIFIGDNAALDLHTQYGLKCNCTCVECGEPVKAVRRGVKDGNPSWSHFSHVSDSNCTGSRESDIHKAAKFVFERSVGENIVLPSVTERDGSAHVSRYSSNGSEDRSWKWKYDEKDPWEAPDYIVVEEPHEEKIISIKTEKSIENNQDIKLIPDILATLENKSGERHQVAFEIRYEHQKNFDDVKKYERLGLDCVEIYVKDLEITDCASIFGALKERLFGYKGEDQHDADYRREYLYCEAIGVIEREKAANLYNVRQSVYKRCERILEESIGKTITLPPVGIYNAFIYHEGEYHDIKNHLLFDFDDRTRSVPFSELTLEAYVSDWIPNIEVFPSQEWLIEEIIIGDVLNGVLFEMMLRISRGKSTFILPVNFAGFSDISLEDLQKQRQSGQSVLEIDYKTIAARSNQCDDEELADILLHEREARNWTFNKAARMKADEKFSLWYNFGLYKADSNLRRIFGNRQSSVISKVIGKDLYSSYPFPSDNSIVVFRNSFRLGGQPVCRCNDGHSWKAQYFSLGIRLTKDSNYKRWSIFEASELMDKIDTAIKDETGDKCFLLRCGLL